MSLPITALMCHAPIVVPAVGGERGQDCLATTEAMAEVARRLVAAAPDVLVVISPHTPRAEGAWAVVDGPRIHGDLGAFGAPGARVDLPAAEAFRERLHAEAPRHGAPTVRLRDRPLDHGALVPLWFVCQAGWRGPTVVIALPWVGAEAPMGRALAALAEGPERVAILASGDMSHRLQPGAPSGYDPRARAFDAAFVEALRRGDLRGATRPDPLLRELAAEDVVASVTVAAAAVDWRTDGLRVLSYEGPFGVGYCEAVLFEEAA